MDSPIHLDSPAGQPVSASERPEGPSEPTLRREQVWLFPKTEQTSLSANFRLREFACRCRSSRCHMTLVHPRLAESLQTLRELLVRPLILSSGYRCPAYNKIVGGRPRSYHTRGMAADILCPESGQLSDLLEAAHRIPAIGGIGAYAGRRFVHVDVRPRDASGRPERWSD